MLERDSKKQLHASLTRAIFGNLALFGLAWLLDKSFGGPKIYIEQTTADVVSAVFLILAVAIISWSILTLARYQMREFLIARGPFCFVRHPIYSAIIFLLNPALGIFLRNWFLLLATIPVYFLWLACIKSEENQLLEKYGQSFLAYKVSVPPFFPNLWQTNKATFYILTAILIFIVTFVSLNFPAVYLRWVVFEKHGKITYDEPGSQRTVFAPGESATSSGWVNPPQANYVEKPNSIIISKIGVNAPLVQASGTTQKELNQALNLGVIIYPGSALPGQNGEILLSGHSSIFPWVKTQYGQVFTLLDKLEPGDTVFLIYNHYQSDYRVTGKQILSPPDVKISDTRKPILTLTTCWPIGTAAKRLVIRAELIR